MSEEFGFQQLLSFAVDDDEEVARELTSPRADSSDSTSLDEKEKKTNRNRKNPLRYEKQNFPSKN